MMLMKFGKYTRKIARQPHCIEGQDVRPTCLCVVFANPW